MKHSFGSDNHSGIAPEILEAIIEANSGFQEAYGDDRYTKEAQEIFSSLFGPETSTYFVFNGTGANILSLATATRSFNSILCPNTAHIFVDECGAPEKLTGCKVIPLAQTNGKLSANTLLAELKGFGVPHHSQPKILTISQPTELGTLYSKSEIKELANLMHSCGGYLHIDGSRISNAAAALNMNVREFTKDCGADILSFGGTKNGLMIGEAVVIFNKELDKDFIYIRKQAAQLFSKNRFITAQFIAYLKEGLYLKLATHANEMAQYLLEKIKSIPQIKVTREVETNAIFAIIDPIIREELLKRHCFYIWDDQTGEVRWMCSFSTQKDDVDNFIKDIKEVIKSK